MLNYLWLTTKRFGVLIPGVAVAYLSVRAIFPYFHHRLPFAVAIFITYILGAYLLIPAIMRAWRLLVPASHLPLYCITPDGFASDPLNIGVIGSRTRLIEAMEVVGWHVAEPYTIRNVAFEVIATIFKKPYHGAPMSALYLFGRKHDIGFEKQLIEQGRGHRHHVRFWATTLDDIQNIDGQKVGSRTPSEQQIVDHLLWVGAASRDNGITLIRQSLQLTHAVAADTNMERELIAHELEKAGVATRAATVELHHSYRLPNRGWFRTLHTDGKMIILRLKR